jgi:integrase
VSPIGRRQVCADASIMAAAGVDIYKVSRWMGHASISTTDAIYTHLFHTDFDADMARLDAYVDNAPEVRSLRGSR